jgi:raffinose/stachyose/melibiose transport system substrate-binding protein
MKKAIVVFLLILVAVFSFAQKLELYYYKQENQEGLKKLVDTFVRQNPSISIDLLIIPNDADVTMAARAASGKLSEILQMQSYSRVFEYAQNGYVLDLSREPVMSKVIESAKPAVTWKGKQWALPMDFAGIGIIYNKDMFKTYGLSAPRTYRDLQRITRTLKSNGVTPYAGLLKENWSIGHFITLAHTNLLAAKGISVEKFIADMDAGRTSYGVVDTNLLFATIDQYVANMDTNAAEMNWNEQQAAFAGSKTPMMVQGLWSYGAAIGTNPSLDAGFVPFPMFNDPKMVKFYADVDSCFGVSAQASPAKQEAALSFLSWLSSPEAVKIWTTDYKLTISFKGADLSAMKPPFVELMSTVGANGAYPWAFSMYPTAVFEDAVKNGAQAYAFKKKSASAVIADIDRQWREAR